MISNNEDRVQKTIKDISDMFEYLNSMSTLDSSLTNAYLCSISAYLKDISLSLAVLTDLSIDDHITDTSEHV